jgi:hypothetical protein
MHSKYRIVKIEKIFQSEIQNRKNILFVISLILPPWLQASRREAFLQLSSLLYQAIPYMGFAAHHKALLWAKSIHEDR